MTSCPGNARRILGILKKSVSGVETCLGIRRLTFACSQRPLWRNTKNTYDYSVQVRNNLLPLSLKVLRHKERDTHSFYSGFFICPHLVRHLPKASASKRKSTIFPLGVQFSAQLTFFKIPKILRALPVRDVIHTC